MKAKLNKERRANLFRPKNTTIYQDNFYLFSLTKTNKYYSDNKVIYLTYLNNTALENSIDTTFAVLQMITKI